MESTLPPSALELVKQATAGKTRIGWIGTGVMGGSMCGHLLNAGFDVTVYSRTPAKSQALLDRGAMWADTPKAVAEQSDIVFAIVGFPRDVREVFLDEQRGALEGCRPGCVLVDMTTSEPTLAVELFETAAKRGVHALDAPVSGGDKGAREGTLSIMIGGDEAVVHRLDACWQAMGKTIIYQGGPGAGQHTKMVNQILISTMMIGVCEALIYGYRAGLDPHTVLQSVGSGAAGSWSLTNLGPRILVNNFDPGFFVDHFVKDMGIALAESRRMGLAMPGLAMAEQLYRAVQAQGYGDRGTHALTLALAQMSGIDWMQRDKTTR
jgi:3-hydroxyisobutyrate dehydrogenase